MKERAYDFTHRLRKGPVRTKQEILDSLKQFSREINKTTFTRLQYDAWPHRALCASQIAHRFGSWAIAMERAELTPQWRPTKSPAEMVEIFMDCWEKNDDAPTMKALTHHLKRINSPYTATMYTRYFGGVRRLAQRVADYHLGKLSEAQLLERYSKLSPTRRPISPALRLSVLTRDKFACVLCGKGSKSHGVALEVDHVIPVSLNGGNDLSNLQTLCEDCNRGKRDRLVGE